MAPTKYGDIGKTGNNLLNDDYKYEGKCEVKTKLESGVNVKSTFTRAEKDGSIGAVLELKKAVSVVDITAKLDHQGAANVTLENSTLVPKLKLKCDAAANGSSTKISADYAHDAIMTCAAFDLNKSLLSVNSSFATNGVTLGASTSYAIKKGKWDTPAIAGSYNGSNFQIAASVENLGEKIGVTYHQSVSKELALALNLQQVDKKGVSLALGSSYKIDKDSSVKAKVDSTGVLSAIYAQKIRPQMTLKVSGQVNTTKLTQDNAHKIGVALLMDY
jgi:voltage-dependent anion channel protein 2